MFAGKTNMHDALAERLETDSEIRDYVGEVESVDFDSSGSNAEFGGARSDTLWILKVAGEKGCIYVHAVVHDSYPNYRVISVAPAKSQQGHVRKCEK